MASMALRERLGDCNQLGCVSCTGATGAVASTADAAAPASGTFSFDTGASNLFTRTFVNIVFACRGYDGMLQFNSLSRYLCIIAESVIGNSMCWCQHRL